MSVTNEKSVVPLTLLDDNESAVIVQLPTCRGVMRLKVLGIVEGKKVRKLSGMPMGGPVTLLVDGRQVAIGHGIASRILVKRD